MILDFFNSASLFFKRKLLLQKQLLFQPQVQNSSNFLATFNHFKKTNKMIIIFYSAQVFLSFKILFWT